MDFSNAISSGGVGNSAIYAARYGAKGGLMPSPSIYSDEEPITDPAIRLDYYDDLRRKNELVLRRCGMKTLAFGASGYSEGGFSEFDIFEAPRGGEVRRGK